MKKKIKELMKKLFCMYFISAMGTTTVKAQNWITCPNGFPNDVNMLAATDQNLYAGSMYDSLGVRSISQYCNSTGNPSWLPMNINTHNAEIWAVANYNGETYVAGYFERAGQGGRNITRWNGINWSPAGGGTNMVVYAMAEYNGELYIGGYFDSAGGQSANFIARWNGNVWNSVGEGVNNYVQTMYVYNGKLYVGGAFDSAGGKPASRIAVWNGASWATLGKGVNGTVTSIMAYNGNLYVGGNFSIAGGLPAKNIASWDGEFWASLDGGTNGTVTSMAVYEGNLYAGGYFTQAGGSDANYIAEWNGSRWSPLGEGTNSVVMSLATYNDVLYVGGMFTMAGNMPAMHIAQWLPYTTGFNQVTVPTESVNVYPNPGNGRFSVSMQNITWRPEIRIYNALGELIYDTMLNPDRTDINIANQAKGVYFYKIFAPDNNVAFSGTLVIR